MLEQDGIDGIPGGEDSIDSDSCENNRLKQKDAMAIYSYESKNSDDESSGSSDENDDEIMEIVENDDNVETIPEAPMAKDVVEDEAPKHDAEIVSLDQFRKWPIFLVKDVITWTLRFLRDSSCASLIQKA